MYRLQYETYKGFVDLDLGEETPAMNYQINTLNELKDRQAAFSQAIKLPKTHHNLRQVGCLDHFDVRPDAVYEPRTCVLSCDGAILTPFGSKLYIDKIDELPNGAIHCQIVAGVTDLFSLLADKAGENMEDAELWAGSWSSDLMDQENQSSDKRRRWPSIITEKGITSAPATFKIGGAYQMYDMVPCYHFNTMITEIFGGQGYDVKSDLTTDTFADQIYVSSAKISSRSHEYAQAICNGLRTPIFIPGAGEGYGMTLTPTLYQNDEYAGVLESRDPEYLSNIPRVVYVATRPADYQIDMTIKNTGTQVLDQGVRKIEYKVFKGKDPAGRGEQIGGTVSPTIYPSQIYTYKSEPIHLNTGEFIAVQVVGWAAKSVIPITTLDFNIIIGAADDQDSCGLGSSFDSVRDTGFKSHKEIIQNYMQLFGALIDVKLQPETGSEWQRRIGCVYIYTFHEIYRRRDAGEMVDWSTKLLFNEDQSTCFTNSGYAQCNELKFAANQADKAYDQASFTIPNKSLEHNKTLFSLGIEASRSLLCITASDLAHKIAIIPTMERDEDKDSSEKASELIYKGCGPHIVQITGQKMHRHNRSGFRSTQRAVANYLPVGVVAPLQSFVDKYYSPLIGILRNGRSLSASFMLSPLDIEQLDFFTPVWVSHYQAYFYISKITNFVAGRPTAVELIKM